MKSDPYPFCVWMTSDPHPPAKQAMSLRGFEYVGNFKKEGGYVTMSTPTLWECPSLLDLTNPTQSMKQRLS